MADGAADPLFRSSRRLLCTAHGTAVRCSRGAQRQPLCIWAVVDSEKARSLHGAYHTTWTARERAIRLSIALEHGLPLGIVIAG